MRAEGSNKFGRTTSHLGDHAGAISVDFLEAVEDLFGASWLKKNKGHRLQMLWGRMDAMATCELYAFGKAIRNLQPRHQRWLESTARKIKINTIDTHGLIFEILVCGYTNGYFGAEIFPAKDSEPGIDLRIKFPDNFTYAISVKNHDISIHEKDFHELSEILRVFFAERLKILGLNGRIFISCEDYMKKEDFFLCMEFLKSDFKEGFYQLIVGRLNIVYRNLVKEDKDFAKTFISNSVIIKCAHHPNEQRNFVAKLKLAGENMKKHVAPDPNRFRLLRMRVHASADIAALGDSAQRMFDESYDCGFDGVMLSQSSGVRTGDGNSRIHTVMRFAIRVQMPLLELVGTHMLKSEIGIGSMGTEPIETIFNVNGEILKISGGSYIYQKTDYYYMMSMDGNGYFGNLQSPASGVNFHSVFEFNGIETAIMAIKPSSEDVLIV